MERRTDEKKQGYTDIHAHLFPGVDDGAQSMEMSLKMFRIAWDNGIRRMILTPHNKPMRRNISRESLEKGLEELRRAIGAEGMDMELYPGSEVYYRRDAAELLERREIPTMAGSSYVLVEFGPMDDFDYMRGGIYQLMAGGYKPILAHAERYKCILSSPGRVKELGSMGCCIQVNAGSVMGVNGWQAKHFTRRLLKEELVHFVATDAHNNGKRAPYLLNCAKYISRHFGEDYTVRILQVNPSKIIADEYV